MLIRAYMLNRMDAVSQYQIDKDNNNNNYLGIILIKMSS